MALLSILKFPDPRLRKKASPVLAVDESIRALAADMAETMYAAPGIGLAATQVDVHKQVIVIDTSEDRSGLVTLINPRIVERDGEQVYEEGCLSVPGIYEKVTRPNTSRSRPCRLDGSEREIEAHGLLAVCIQHEMDHLLGKVFVDHLSQLKQSRIKNRSPNKPAKAPDVHHPAAHRLCRHAGIRRPRARRPDRLRLRHPARADPARPPRRSRHETDASPVKQRAWRTA
jgi:peptide deformylase